MASARVRLVSPYTTSTVVTPRAVRSRVSRNTCESPGQSARYSLSQVEVASVRDSTRPRLSSRVEATSASWSHCS